LGKRHLANEVTFIAPTGEMVIRLMDDTYQSQCSAAETLRARYYVAVDRTDPTYPWAIFDMRKAQKGNPTPGCWTVGDPVKLFPRNANDAAVVYACMLAGKAVR
jgi:hypothetical protein